MGRIYAIAVSILLCGAVLAPIRQGFLPEPQDDFPLSWYPMFARPRPAQERPIYVVAADADGARHKVPQTFWTSGGFNQGATQLIRSAAAGDSLLAPLCGRIAARIAQRAGRDPELAAAVEVRVLKGRYDRARWFRDGDHAPIQEVTLTRCRVPERPSAGAQ